MQQGSRSASSSPAPDPAHPDGPLTLPARWEMRGVTLSQSVAASYVAGTLLVRTELQQANFAASLNRLHRGMGTGLPWQLVGIWRRWLLLLALTSLLMWNKLHGPRARHRPAAAGRPGHRAGGPALGRLPTAKRDLSLGGGNLARTSGNKG